MLDQAVRANSSGDVYIEEGGDRVQLSRPAIKWVTRESALRLN